MYKITQWDSRYEVNRSGDVFRPGSKQRLRSTPLNYVRSKVHGRQLGAGMRRLKAAAGDRTMEVFGIFHKFLEIAADAGKGQRGCLLNSDSLDDPATASNLAFILNTPQTQIDNALTVLLGIGWLSESSGNIPKLRETPGTPVNSGETGHLKNETETEPNRSEPNETGPEELTACELPQAEADGKGDVKDSDLIIKDDSDSDSEVTANNDQTFLLRLLMILPRWSRSDKTCFQNLAQMLGDMVDPANAFGAALVIARECHKNGGDNPKQAFMHRVQKHFNIKLQTEWRSNEAKREQTIKKAEE